MGKAPELTQATFAKACQAAAARLWKHRKALRRVAVRIGYWPEGLVISANIPAVNDDELKAIKPPHVIPWDQVATITEAEMVAIVDQLCEPIYDALGIVRPA